MTCLEDVAVTDEEKDQGSEKPAVFLKKAQPIAFLGFYWVLGIIGFFTPRALRS